MMIFVIFSLFGLCCGQNIGRVNSEFNSNNFASVEQRILETIKQPTKQLVESSMIHSQTAIRQNIVGSDELKALALKILDEHLKSDNWQKYLNESLANITHNMVVNEVEGLQQQLKLLEGSLESCSDANTALNKTVQGLEHQKIIDKVGFGNLRIEAKNMTARLNKVTQKVNEGNMRLNNVSQELRNEIQQNELKNDEIIDLLVENVTRLTEHIFPTIHIGSVSGTGLYVRSTAKVIYGREKLRKKEKPDCHNIYTKGIRKDGIYTVAPDGWPSTPFKVFCDMTDGGWTLLQRRVDGSENFTRPWTDYANGFGDLSSEFWLGLEKIHFLTRTPKRVKFDFELRSGSKIYLKYGSFQVLDPSSKYRLRVSQHISGLKSNSFIYNNGQSFSTHDRDNRYGCSRRRYGGWWYNNCTYLNINGKYDLQNSESGMTEHCCGSRYNNFRKTTMKIQ